jgi:hypothetical protein
VQNSQSLHSFRVRRNGFYFFLFRKDLQRVSVEADHTYIIQIYPFVL